jgi:outer membrane protein assembly factor BamB
MHDAKVSTRAGSVLERWLVVVALVSLAGGCERAAENKPESGARDPSPREMTGPGLWRRLPALPSSELTEDQRKTIDNLEAIGYLGGSESSSDSGVSVNRPGASTGYNLYTDGHAAEAVLMDTDGNVVHRWRCAYAEAFPESERSLELPGTQWWRYAHLLPGGDLLAIFGGQGIIKLDKDSRLLWANDIRAHHQLQVMPDGTIVTLTRKASVLPWADPDEPVLEDFLTVLNAEGEVASQLSLVEAFYESEFRYIVEEREVRSGDVLHTNSLQVLDGRHSDRVPAFAAGNVLISSRTTNALAVVDPSTGKVVWAKRGDFRAQHDAQLLANGNLIVFDNSGLAGASRILELDPESFDIVWEYRGTAESPFHSEFLGAVERLPNGSTLITDSNWGRAFEVTPAGEIVWEFYTPRRAGPNEEFIAALSRMHRLPEGFELP